MNGSKGLHFYSKSVRQSEYFAMTEIIDLSYEQKFNERKRIFLAFKFIT